jgi:hypothetical protein
LTCFIFFDRAVKYRQTFYHQPQNNFLRTKIVLAVCSFSWKQCKDGSSRQCQPEHQHPGSAQAGVASSRPALGTDPFHWSYVWS